MRRRRVRSSSWVGSFLAGCLHTAMTIFLVDVLQQIIFEKVSLKDLDWKRSFQNMGVGFIFGGLVSQIISGLLCSLMNARISSCRKVSYYR